MFFFFWNKILVVSKKFFFIIMVRLLNMEVGNLRCLNWNLYFEIEIFLKVYFM